MSSLPTRDSAVLPCFKSPHTGIENGSIAIDLLPEVDIHGILKEQRHRKMLLTTLLDQFLPGRLAKLWCDLNFKSRPLNQYSSQELDSLARLLHDWQVRPAGSEGFNKAEVTLGGVDTNELSSRTMESTRVPGLYFLGELIDVTGHLGGIISIGPGPPGMQQDNVSDARVCVSQHGLVAESMAGPSRNLITCVQRLCFQFTVHTSKKRKRCWRCK